MKFNSSKCPQILLGLNLKGPYLSLEKEKLCVVLTYSIKQVHKIRKFHVAVIQQQLRNVQKSKLHVQGCCYARRNLLHFCPSYCHCRHYCSSSLLFCFCDITLLSIEFNWKTKVPLLSDRFYKYLFNMKEVFSIKRHCSTMHWGIIIYASVIRNVCSHSKCHLLWLDSKIT